MSIKNSSNEIDRKILFICKRNETSFDWQLMITYSLRDDGIFYVTFSETVTVNDILKYLQDFEALNNLPKDLLTMYDLRDVDMDITSRDIISIAKMTEMATVPFKTVRTAFLVDKPNLTAFSILFTEELVPVKTKRNVFSTEKAALNWLRSY